MTGFILAAGLGTRLKPFTDKHPKALALVGGKTLLEIQILKMKAAGITTIVVNVFHFAEQIIQFLEEQNHFGCNIIISDERPEVLETGGGLKFARNLFNTSNQILIQNVDILSNISYSKLLHFHNHNNADASLAVTDRKSSRQLLFQKEISTLKLCGWRNMQTMETKPIPLKEDFIPLSFSGIHIVNTHFIDCIPQTGKFSIIDSYISLVNKLSLLGFDHSGDTLLDVGKPEQLVLANANPSIYI